MPPCGPASKLFAALPCPARSPARARAAAPWGDGAQPAGRGSRAGCAARSTLGSRWRQPAHRSCGREGEEAVCRFQEGRNADGVRQAWGLGRRHAAAGRCAARGMGCCSTTRCSAVANLRSCTSSAYRPPSPACPICRGSGQRAHRNHERTANGRQTAAAAAAVRRRPAPTLPCRCARLLEEDAEQER